MLIFKCSHLQINNKKCNKFHFITINKLPYCFNHSQLLYNKYVIIIQKYYKGYKSRKYLKNIFKKLPCDIQNIIKFYINESLYNKKYINTLTKIITNNTHDLHNYMFYDKKLTIKYIYNCYKLYDKYHSIIPITHLKHLYCLAEPILNLCDTLINNEQEIFLINHAYNIFDKIQLYNLDYYDIINLIDIIYKFSTVYSFKYQLYSYNYYNLSLI